MTALNLPGRRRKGKPAAAGLHTWLQRRRDRREMRRFTSLVRVMRSTASQR